MDFFNSTKIFHRTIKMINDEQSQRPYKETILFLVICMLHKETHVSMSTHDQPNGRVTDAYALS